MGMMAWEVKLMWMLYFNGKEMQKRSRKQRKEEKKTVVNNFVESKKKEMRVGAWKQRVELISEAKDEK